MAATIQELVAERNIKCLAHFTKLANLPSIWQRGLLTRDIIEREGNPDVWNDADRHDGTNAVCATIGFPNYKMFYPLRCDAPDGTDWIVVALRPSVLWELPCAFCVENAAQGRVTAIHIDQRRGLPALEAMYADYPDKPRALLNLPSAYPTHPQAEVLILSNVPSAYILGFAVSSLPVQQRALALLPGLQYTVLPSWFNGRPDFAHWR